MSFNNLFHAICPFSIGQRVTVDPNNKYAAEWREEYAVVGIAWEYQEGAGDRINITIASADDIQNRYGPTDGWAPNDLLPVRS